MDKRIKKVRLSRAYEIKRATGIFWDLGIKELHYSKGVDPGEISDYILERKPEQITERVYRYGQYILKFKPPGSLKLLYYCQQLGLPVENPLIMGRYKDRGEVLIFDTVDGDDYEGVLLGERRFLKLRRPILPREEMESLGKTAYLFCSKGGGILLGDSFLRNYMYDGTAAIRVDIVPKNCLILDIDWGQINQDSGSIGDFIEEKYDGWNYLVSDVGLVITDMADKLTNTANYEERFLGNSEAFLTGYANDELSGALAEILWSNAQKLPEYMKKARDGHKSFMDLYIAELEKKKECGEMVIIRKGKH